MPRATHVQQPASTETQPPVVPKKPFNLAEWAGLGKTPPTIDEQFIVDLTPEETTRLAELKLAWAERSRPTRNETSPAWQRTCERMLPLLVLSEEEALDQFEAWRDALSWAETTSAQYWAALRKAAFILNISLSNFYKIQGKVLGYAAKEADERRPTIPAQQAEIETTAHTLTPPLSLLLRTAFVLGQRVGDVSQLQTKRITTMHDPVTKQEFVCLQFRRGKTTRRRQPFTLHLPLSTPEASELWERAQKHEEDLLFVNDRGLGLRTIAVALKKTSPELCLLSVRRGGLQRMALNGASMATLLHHSRHTTEAMLDRYLGWGLCNLISARELNGVGQNTSA
jgi:integrase